MLIFKIFFFVYKLILIASIGSNRSDRYRIVPKDTRWGNSNDHGFVIVINVRQLKGEIKFTLRL